MNKNHPSFLDYFILQLPRNQSFSFCLRAPRISVECSCLPFDIDVIHCLCSQMRHLHFPTSHTLLCSALRTFFYCSDMSAERSRCQSRHRKLQRFACRRNEFDFEVDIFFFASLFCFSLCLFSRILGFDKRRGHCCRREGSAGGRC